MDSFFGRRYSIGLPPLGSFWYAVGCIGFCVSDESQEAADLCAQQQAVLCQSTNWPVLVSGPNPLFPFIPQDRQVFSNNAQFCTFTCPDGSPFNFTVASGLFSAFSQAAADAEAYSYACNQVVVNRLCLSALSPSRTCASSPYEGICVASSINTPITFSITGELPDGLLLAQNETTAVISGTPTTPGDYVFTLVATDAVGNSVNKVLELTVFGISTESPLPEAVLNAAYSETLQYAGTPAGTVTWSLIAGILPDGVTLNTATGEISGTPTNDGLFLLTIGVSDGTLLCSKNLVLNTASTCPFPSSFSWGNVIGPFTQGDGALVAGNVDTALSGTGSAGPCDDPENCNSAAYSAEMTFVYAGPGFDLHLEGTFTSAGNANSGFSIDAWDGDTSTGIFMGSVGVTANTETSPFDVALPILNPTVNGFVTVRFSIFVNGCVTGGACEGENTTFDFNATLGC